MNTIEPTSPQQEYVIGINDKLLTAKDIMKRLNVCKSFAYKFMHKSGKTIRIDRAIRMRESDFNEIIHSLEQKNDKIYSLKNTLSSRNQ